MKQYQKKKSLNVIPGSHGFTLVELMLAMLITGIIVAAIYAAYVSQQRVYLAQEQVAEMQQNIRAAIGIMTSEIRMAGYDGDNGTQDSTCGVGASGAATDEPGILTATSTQVDFSRDLDGDGDCADTGENLSYYIYASGGVQKLGRLDNNSPPVQAVAENFDGLEFRYLDASGNVTAVPADVRSIQVSILARAGQADRDFTNPLTYTPASGVANNWGPYNDNFRRRLLITTVNCRNMGL